MNDWLLLRRYLENGDETAFTSLLQQHLTMVYSVALRILSDANRAEEVAQTTFFLLAKKGQSLPEETILGGWLYKTSCLLAHRTYRDLNKRKTREEEAAIMLNTSVEVSDPPLAGVLDEAVGSLSEEDRMAIVLKYFQDLNHSQLAKTLGISEAAAKKRVSRALGKLRLKLGRLGIAVTAVHLASFLETRASVVPGESVYQSVLEVVAGRILPTTSPELTAPISILNKFSAGLAIAALLAALFAVLWFFIPGSKFPAGSISQPPGFPPAVAPFTVMGEEKLKTEPLLLELRIVEEESGIPIPNARVRLVSYLPKTSPIFYATDRNGILRAPKTSADFNGLVVGIAAPGRVPIYVFWTQEEELAIPFYYEAKLKKGTELNGMVVNAAGQPVAGASISFNGGGGNIWNSREALNLKRPWINPVTDSEGRWHIDFYPEGYDRCYGSVSHPDYATSNFNTNIVSGEMLVISIEQGLRVAGTVLDQNQEPIQMARVAMSDISGWREALKVETDMDGAFEFPQVGSGQFTLDVSSENFWIPHTLVELGPSRTNILISGRKHRVAGDFVLRGRVLDSQGTVHSGVFVSLAHGQTNLQDVKWSSEVDNSGRFEWREAPPFPVKIIYGGEKWETKEALLNPDGTEHFLRLDAKELIRISGRVRAADSGELIRNLKVYLGKFDQSGFDPYPTRIADGVTGFFESKVTKSQFRGIFSDSRKAAIVIEAPGFVGREFLFTNLPPTNLLYFDCSLMAQVRLFGEVTEPNGSPAAQAQIAMGIKNAMQSMERPGVFAEIYTPQRGRENWKADDIGRFEIPVTASATHLIAVHSNGWAEVPLSGLDLKEPLKIRLQTYGEISGKVIIGGKKWPNVEVLVSPTSAKGLAFSYRTRTDEEGTFVFEGVPPGDVYLRIIMQGKDTGFFSHPTFTTVTSGRIAEAVIGGSGTRLVGRMVPAPESGEIAWKRSGFHLVPEKNDFPKDGRGGQTVYLDYGFFCDEQGVFTVHDVPPGKYRLSGNLVHRGNQVDHAGNISAQDLGRVERKISIPEDTEEIDLGGIMVPLDEK